MRKADEDIQETNLLPETLSFDHICKAMIEVGTKSCELDKEHLESLKGMIEYYRAAPAAVKTELDAVVQGKARKIQAAMRLEFARRTLEAGNFAGARNPRFPH